MSTNSPDILIYGNSNLPLAVVEVKNLHRLALAQALELRRAIIEIFPWSNSFFLLISQTAGYLWEPTETFAPDVRPAVSFDMRPVLRDYLTDHALDGHLRGDELELAVMQWLNDLSRGRGRLPANETPIAEFALQIRGARVEAVGSVL